MMLWRTRSNNHNERVTAIRDQVKRRRPASPEGRSRGLRCPDRRHLQLQAYSSAGPSTESCRTSNLVRSRMWRGAMTRVRSLHDAAKTSINWIKLAELPDIALADRRSRHPRQQKSGKTRATCTSEPMAVWRPARSKIPVSGPSCFGSTDAASEFSFAAHVKIRHHRVGSRSRAIRATISAWALKSVNAEARLDSRCW